MMILYVLVALVLLGVLITVHEFGHFAAARALGIPVKEFSVGFGPKIYQRQSRKTGTLLSLRPILLGGYCMFYGDTDDDPKGEHADDPRNYNKAPVWKRMISVAAGPLMNLVLAYVVAVVFMAAYGLMLAPPNLASVEPGQPAEAAGLRAGDIVVAVNGQDMEDVEEVTQAISNAAPGEALEMEVQRGQETFTCTVTPFYDEAEGRYRIGVTLQNVMPLPANLVLSEAWNLCVSSSTAILEALGKLVTTGEGLDQTSGPVGIVQVVAQGTQEGGLYVLLGMAVMISINLGLVNLLPIPALDGSRLVFMALEAVRRKPVSQRVEAMVHMCGYVALLALMLFFTFKDVARIFIG